MANVTKVRDWGVIAQVLGVNGLIQDRKNRYTLQARK